MKTIQSLKSQAFIVSSLLMAGVMASSGATTVFTETFSAYTSVQPVGTQYQSGLKIYNAGTVTGWTGSGAGAVHAVNRDGVGNFAPMFYKDNTITVAQPVAASNLLGNIYSVGFDAGPGVYEASSQVTTSLDGLVITVLRANSTVLSTFTYQPDPWAGAPTLVPVSFNYTGDGTGDVRFRIATLRPTADTFGGTVDNFIVTVPEPTTAGLVLLSSLMVIRRTRAAR